MMVGFGLLFLGLDFMKASVDAMQGQFGLEHFKNLNLREFGILWFILTIMISSSWAVSILTLAALDGGIISFPAAIAIWRGATIGTTFPAVLWSLGGWRIKSQLAASHVLFNAISVVISLIFFWQYIWLINDVLWFDDKPVMGNAVLNIIFDASTALLLWFLLTPFTKFIVWLIPSKKDTDLRLKVLDATVKGQKSGATFASAKLYALHEDCKALINYVAVYNAYLFGRDMKELKTIKGSKKVIKAVDRDKTKHKEMYFESKKISDIMFENLLPLKNERLPKDVGEISEHVEKTIYSAVKSAKSTKNIYRDIQDLKESESNVLKDIYHTYSNESKEFYIHVAHITDSEYKKENFHELGIALKRIETYHHGFIEMVTKFITKSKDFEEIDIPSLINIDHYIYQSAKTMVKALQNTYLTDQEESSFEEIHEAEEEQQ